MLKQFILFGAALSLAGCFQPPHPCDIGASPLTCEYVEPVPNPYLTFNGAPNQSASVAERGTATFNIVLHYKKPYGNIVVDLSASDATEAVLSTSQLTFTPSNWETPQTVTITGPVDNITDGSQSSTITAGINSSSGDLDYEELPNMTMSLTTTDTDVDGMVISGITGTVAETGSTDTFTLALSSSPDCTGNVVIDLTDNDTDNSEISYTPTSLTYTSADWFTAQTVTITGQNDFLEDGNITNLITLAVNAGSTCDPDYDSLSSSFYTVTNTDDDTAGITISSQGGQTNLTEAGSTYIAGVVLTAQPTSNVVIDITDNDTDNTEVSISPTSLTFTTGDWNTRQDVTLTGRDDYKADGNQQSLITLAVNGGSTADTDYSAMSNQTFTVDTVDDDTVAVILSQTTASVNESGTTDTFTIRLGTLPSKTVQIDLTDNDTDNSEVSYTPTSLSFTTGNWNTAQTVTITGLDDSLEDADISTVITVAVNGTGDVDTDYAALANQTVTVTTANDDFRVPLVSDFSRGTIYENGSATTATANVRLGMAPASNVVLNIDPNSTSSASRANISPTQLTFTPANYNTNQTVTVTVVDNNLLDGNQPFPIVVSVDPALSDDAWDSIANVTRSENDNLLRIYVNDNETRTWTTVGINDLAINESGTSDTFTIVLDHDPDSANITFYFVPPSSTDFSITDSVVFDTSNWSTPQTITVTGVDNDAIDGTRTKQIYIRAQSTRSGTTVEPTQLTLYGNITVSDNDTAAYTNLVAGWYHFCMVKELDGSVWCWGRNDTGQLGDGSTTNSQTPVRAGSITNVVSLGAEKESTCALDNSSELYCWGKFFEGDGSTRSTYTSPQAMSGGSAPFGNIPAGTTIFGNGEQDLFTFNGTAVRVTGDNGVGEHGEGDTASNRTAVDPSWGLTPKRFFLPGGGVNRNNGCFQDNATGKLYCMGDGAEGFFYDGNNSNRNTPTEVTAPGTDFVDYAMSGKTFMYIAANGDLYGWGVQSGEYGILGLNNTNDYTTAQRVDLSGYDVKEVALSRYFSCIRFDDESGNQLGYIKCTGRNDRGQLGYGDSSPNVSYGSILFNSALDIAASYESVCTIQGDGTLYCWGSNTYGELGGGKSSIGGLERSPVNWTP